MRTNLIVIILIISMNSCQEDKKATQTYNYFCNAEIQYETDFQKKVIVEAINDLIKLDSTQLKSKRYSNYNQKGEFWNITELINKYFVPDKKGMTLGDNFFLEVRDKEVQDVLGKFLNDLQHDN